jgi:hypothetical protein
MAPGILSLMTREDATARCAELNREQPGEPRWFVSRAGTDEWHVVSVAAPGSPGPLHAAIASHPAPEHPPDPRPSLIRNIPPFGA